VQITESSFRTQNEDHFMKWVQEGNDECNANHVVRRSVEQKDNLSYSAKAQST